MFKNLFPIFRVPMPVEGISFPYPVFLPASAFGLFLFFCVPYYHGVNHGTDEP
jgi:hypothetical protein